MINTFLLITQKKIGTCTHREHNSRVFGTISKVRHQSGCGTPVSTTNVAWSSAPCQGGTSAVYTKSTWSRPCHCEQLGLLLEKKQSKEGRKGFFWLTFGGTVRHGEEARQHEFEVAWHLLSGTRKQWVLALSSPTPLYLVRDSVSWNAAAHG